MPLLGDHQAQRSSQRDPVYRLVALFGKILFWVFVGGFLLLGAVTYSMRNHPPAAPSESPPDPKRDYLPWVQPYAQWAKGGFGRVLVAKIVIANQGDRAVKDVTLKCTLYGKSGTAIEAKSVTVYELIGPRESTARAEHNLGFITGQEDSMTCETIDFAWGP